MDKKQFFNRIVSVFMAVIMIALMLPTNVFAKVNSTSKFSTPYKNSKYYTALVKAKNGSYSSAGMKLAAIAESQVGYKEGIKYEDLDGSPATYKWLSYKSGSKYKNYKGYLDTCEYNFWYYGCSDSSKVTQYTSSTKTVSGAKYPVSNYNKAWCAAFVSWCAAQAGLSSKIPASAGAGTVCDKAIDKGGYKINADDRQPGDLVYYYCSKCKARSHVGIVSTNKNYSIEGNTNDGVSKVNLTKAVSNTCMSGHTTKRYYVRPNICSHSSTYSKITTAATCTKEGVRTYYCKACDAKVKTATVAKTAHSYDKYDHCSSCGEAYPLKSTDVTTGVYKTSKEATIHSTAYTKGKGGKSNTLLTLKKGSAVTVDYAGKNADNQTWYHVVYTDSSTGKKTEGFIRSTYLSKKQTSFSFYEGGEKLFNVKLTGTVSIPKTSNENKSGYTLKYFTIYKDTSSTSRQYYTNQGVWATSSQIAKNNYTVKQYKLGSTYCFDQSWIDNANRYTTKYYLDAEWEKVTQKTYTVTYDANGGSGAPAKQTKTTGQTITLSSSKPTRSGYVFMGWATKSNGSVVYKAGASYSADANVTLYAVWTKNPITWKTVYAKNIKSTSALVGCTVTADCSKINRIGLQLKEGNGSWKTVASWKVNKVLDYCTVQCGGSGSEISGNLKKNTTYSYRFYVETTNVGTQYSATKTFKTKS